MGKSVEVSGLRRAMHNPTSIRHHPIRRITKLVRLLGVRDSIRYLVARMSRRPTVALRPKGFPHHLECRVSGSDVFVMWQVFGKDDCRIPPAIRPKVILDGGAYVGYTTAMFARRYPEAMIIAVEPDSANVELLRKNTARYPNVQVIQAGLWKRDARLLIENPAGQPWEFRVVESEATTAPTIEGVTIATALSRFGEGRADVVKLDVEGSEEEIFAHGRLDWLDGCRFVIVETHGSAATDAVIRATETAFQVSRQGEKITLVRA